MLGQSWRLWQATNLPYESARARLHYAEALAAEGDAATARRDLLAARAVFERLGATLDLQRIDALLAGRAGRPGRLDAARPAGDADLHVHRHRDLDRPRRPDRRRRLERPAALARSRAPLGVRRSTRGEEVAHTGDGFFVAFQRAADGIECAVDIQRRLARHRREHGFAPWVRIGLHAAEATRERRNYIGGGVHVAARVGAAAGEGGDPRDPIAVVDGAGADPVRAVRAAPGDPQGRPGAGRGPGASTGGEPDED